ncbi:casein kinase ii subunit beta isoform 1 [Stylonychia lemnae]|uniref:Casein kinase II subunit beta n=1 Tax=Stylonychia lemnae TaxID=5949 RepID=A0A078AIK4_STYLE|nr:casein kinase ii subunit beta isoform 1 [Stylonychia lemnae]|eukprot:CDW81322.1 casein kinase ii subunit beta isoform 1 [Stylonychia lemnae]
MEKKFGNLNRKKFDEKPSDDSEDIQRQDFVQNESSVDNVNITNINNEQDDISSDHFLTVSEGSSSSFVEDSEPDSEETWIEWFCRKKGNEFLCQVDQQYMMDDFNLTFLKSQVENYKDAYHMILDMEDDYNLDELNKKDMDTQIQIKKDAIKLYGLLHQRFIQSSIGLEAMKSKMMKGDFGFCPRVLCEKQPVIPWGETVHPGVCQTRVFCPKCKGLFQPDYQKHQKLDGSFFGPNLAGILLISYPKIIIGKQKTDEFQPKLFGFKMHKDSPIRPRKIIIQARIKQEKKNKKNSF